MTEQRKRRRLLTWVLCAVLVLAAEAGVCAVVFIPQSRNLQRVARQRTFVEEQLSVVVQAPETYREMKRAIRGGRDLMAKLDLFRSELAQQVIMESIIRADDPSALVVVELTPVPEDELDEEKRIGESWRLTCRAGFGKLTHFLNRIEMQGILLDNANFVADAAEKEEGVELTTVMRVFSEKSLERLQQKTAESEKQQNAKKS